MRVPQRLGVPFLILIILITSVNPPFSPVRAQDNQPTNVSLPGTIQPALGCDGEWQPECPATQLVYDADDDVWTATFDLPAGEYEYKVAINNTWDENYGLNAESNGPNIPLVLEADTSVTFIYSHDSHWVGDSVNHIIATVPGSYQDEIGCSGEWQPDCLRSWLQDPDGDGVYSFTAAVPVGDYEAKVAINQAWDENYGAEGVAGGPNIPFSVAEDSNMLFSYDPATHLLTIESQGPAVIEEQAETSDPEPPVVVSDIEQPANVSIPGTIQSVLGCPGDWQPECDVTQLVYDPADDLWFASFDLPAGSYEYKVAINNTWDENYGLNAEQNGPNIPLVLEEDATVQFYYSHATHWVADNVNYIVANVPGNYQDEIGCPGEWQPDCLRSWLQDPDGDGVYTFGTTKLLKGNYEAKVALNQSWTLNYGADGQRDGPNIAFFVPEDGSYILFSFDTSNNLMTITADGEIPTPPIGDITQARAYWVSRDTILWDIPRIPNSTYTLHYSLDGGMVLGDNAIEGGEVIELRYDRNGASPEIVAKFPHLKDFLALKIPEDRLSDVPEILKGQLAVFASYLTFEDVQEVIGATGLQIAGVLDDLYTYDGDLGATFSEEGITLSVWAPTARSVKLHVFDDAEVAESTVYDMTHDTASGVWSVTGDAEWNAKYYLYEVEVYAPSTSQVEHNMVTDPYSFSLSLNSARSQIVDLNDPALMPDGWSDYEKPALERPEDIVLYELHIRDFSVNDLSVPEALRGTFAAFTVSDSNGMTHLQRLAEAGLTHVHLLPLFDIATINENKAEWQSPAFEDLAAFPPDSEEQQALIEPTRDLDGFNWGYDPYHYTTPEGSYSTNPNGTQRILEFRQMIMALNQTGLRVVMDVVYNHTNASGQGEKSVLDRIVPGYYHRLDEKGSVATSTCCQNTATEHNMMRRLMIDSVITWSTAYKVDGYRFDLMGHHMLADMIAVREALDTLTLDNDGVDGSSIYVYGEGWNFGEVANNARGVNATQLNIGGTGIGVFNDRLRDAVRGGNPFGGWQEQGFVTGLYYDPNEVETRPAEEQLQRVMLFADQIRIGLAGNLRDYSFMGYQGTMVTGADIDYNGSPAGYTLDPQENIVYIEAHDNETWFDAMTYKVPTTTSLDDRVRIYNVGLSIVALSQGVPFFHAGAELLRSKSFDRNSYNSGDWFNRLDFTYQSNNFGVGLPLAGDNQNNWEIMRPLLAQEGITPGNAEIIRTLTHFQEMLQIRQSSPLFRLETAAEVQSRLTFYNLGPAQIPGLIVMSLSDMTGTDLDPNYAMIVVVFNASDETLTFIEPSFAGVSMRLHPVQVVSADPVVQESIYFAASGTFIVPAQTTAVFVAPQN